MKHALFRIFVCGKFGTECLNTRSSLPTLLYAEYNVKFKKKIAKQIFKIFLKNIYSFLRGRILYVVFEPVNISISPQSAL